VILLLVGLYKLSTTEDTKSTLQNSRRPLVAQAFRPAKRPPGSPKGLRYA